MLKCVADAAAGIQHTQMQQAAASPAPPSCCETGTCPEGTDCGDDLGIPIPVDPPCDDKGPLPEGRLNNVVGCPNHHCQPTVQECLDAGRPDLLRPPEQHRDSHGNTLRASHHDFCWSGKHANGVMFQDDDKNAEFLAQDCIDKPDVTRLGCYEDGTPVRSEKFGKFAPNPGVSGPRLPERPGKNSFSNLPVIENTGCEKAHVQRLGNQEKMRMDLNISEDAPREILAVAKLSESRTEEVIRNVRNKKTDLTRSFNNIPPLTQNEMACSPDLPVESAQTRKSTSYPTSLKPMAEITQEAAAMVEKPVRMDIEYVDIGKMGGGDVHVKLSSTICTTQIVTSSAKGALELGAMATPAAALLCLPAAPGTPPYATCIGVVVGIAVVASAAKGAADALDTPSCQAVLGHLKNQGEGRAQKYSVD